MKIYLRSTLFWVCLFVCALSSRAYAGDLIDEDFSSISSGIPEGWDISSSTIGTVNNFRYSAESDGPCLKMKASTSSYGGYNVPGDKAILMSPSLNMLSPQALSFKYKTSYSPGYKFNVYVSTDGGKTYLNNVVTSDLSKTTTWTKVECDLSAYSGNSNVRIVFHVELDGTNKTTEVFLDDILVSDFPQCAVPQSLSVSNAKPTSVDLLWQLHQWGGIPSKYSVLVYDGNNNIVVSKQDTAIYGTLISISGLQPSTTYTARVQSSCEEAGKGKSIWSEELTFTTLCSTASLPYQNNFDAESDKLPMCWGAGGTNASYVKLQSSTAISGNALEIYSKDDKDACAVSPQIAHSADDLEISFKVLGEDFGGSYMIAVMTDITDITSALPVYNGKISSENTWSEVVFNTSAYDLDEITNAHIAIYLPAADMSNTIIFDDFKITEIPSCIRPMDLTVSNITSSAATFAWSSNGSSNNWEIKLQANGVSTVIPATTNPFNFSQLTENSDYTVAVRELCSSTDYSEWSSPVNFSTACSPLSKFPFHESFDDVVFPPQCWESRELVRGTIGIGSTYGAKNWVRNTYASNRHSGAGAAQLQLTKEGTVSIFALPPMDIPTADTYELRFWMYRNDGKNYNEGLEILANTSLDTIGAIKMGYIDRDYSVEPAEPVKGYYQYTFPIPVGGEQVIIMFKSRSNHGTNTYIDDVEVMQIPSCPRVKDITLDSVSRTSAQFSWTPSGSESQWEFGYKTNQYQKEYTTMRVSSPKAVVPNLVPGSPYNLDVMVKAVCSESDMSEVVSIVHSFITECEPQTIPYIEDFEAITILNGTYWNFVTPLCWEILSKNSSTYPTVQNSTTFSKEFCFDKANKVITKELSLDSWIGKRIRFDARTEYNSTSAHSRKLIVSIAKSPADADLANAIAVDTIEIPNIANAKASYIVNFTQDYEGRYIVLESEKLNSKKFWIDNLNVEALPTCLETDGFDIEDITTNSAKVNISVSGEAPASWDIEYGPSPLSASTSTIINVSSATGNIINNLSEQSNYDIRIRNACSDSDKGAWSAIKEFKTLCSPFEVSSSTVFFEGFEDGHINKEPVAGCWTIVDKSESTTWTANSSETSYCRKPHEGSFSAYLKGGEDYMYRAITLKAGVNYKFSCFARRGSSTTTAYYAADMKVYIANTPSTLDQLIINHTVGYSAASYFEIKEFFTVPTDGTYYLALGAKLGKYAYLSVDNIKIEESNCPAVVGSSISVPVITSDSAKIRWSGSASQYKVKVSTTPIDPAVDAADIFDNTVTADSLVLSNLSSITKYYYYIQSDCGTSFGDWAAQKDFTTECAPYAVPYSENFDITPTSFDCWAAMGDNLPTKAKPYFTPSTSTYAMKFDGGVTVASPEFDVNSLTTYQLSAKVYAKNDNALLTVGVSNSQTDIDAYESINDINIPTKDTWTEVVVYFNILNKPGYSEWLNARYIVLTVSEDHELFVDDIKVELVPTCPKPSALIISDVMDTSFSLAWTAGSETEWAVKVKDVDGNVAYNDVVNTNPTSISGLQPNTQYNVELAAVCAIGDTSEVSRLTLNTICSPLNSTPFVENFETSEGQIIECWTSTSSSKSTSEYYWWHVDNEDISSNAAVYRCSNAMTDWAQLTSPNIDLKDLTSAELSFDYMNAIGGKLYVLASTDAGATFIDTIAILNNDITSFTSQSFDISKYCGDELTIAFKAYSNKVNAYRDDPYIRIDNIRVKKPITCLPPDAIELLESKESGIKLAIDDASENNIWEAVILPMSADINTIDENSIDIVRFSSDTILFSEFDYSARCYVAVRRVCGSENSLWLSSSSFATPCGIASIPYSNDFEDVDSYEDILCFDQRGWGGTAFYSSYPNAEVSSLLGVIDGDRSFVMNSSSNGSLFITLPQFNESVENLNIALDYKYKSTTNSAGLFSIGLLPKNMDTTKFINIATLERSMSVNHVNLDVRHADVSGTDYLVALRYLGTGKTDANISIDNIVISKANDCAAPLNVDVRNIDINYADVMIVDEHNSKWEIAYGPKGTAFEDLTVVTNLTQNFNQISELTGATVYELYARSICGDNYSEWTQMINFATACDVINIDDANPYTENFDRYVEDDEPLCWNIIKGNIDDMNGGSYPSIHDGDASSSPNVLKLSLTNGGEGVENIIALPAVNVPINKTILSFQAKGGSTSKLKIGYTNDLNDPKACVDVYTIDLTDGKMRLRVADLTIFPEDAQYVYFRTNERYSSDTYIDDVRLAIAPTCTAPKDITLVEVLDNSAKIAYRACEDNTKVQIEYVANNDTNNLSFV